MWIYKGKEFTSDMIGDYIGFVYLLTCKKDGMKYIGKKKLIRKIKRPPLKGKKRKRISIVESDWKTYCGSSGETMQIKEDRGVEAFDREILYLCLGAGEMSYLEMREQVLRDALLRDDYYNGIIQCRIHHTHVNRLKNNEKPKNN